MRTDGAKFLDWAMIRGYGDAKRALEVAASGYLSILLVGPAGSGKATLARSLHTILPDAAFLEPDPFVALSVAIDQAISSRGILFLKNIERWSDSSLVLLHESVVQHPGQFLLIATTGYCPCGNYMDERKECICTYEEVQVYQERLRETVHACFAIEQQIQSVNPECRSRDESSLEVRERVKATLQFHRQRNSGSRFISELSLSEMQVGDLLLLDELAQHLLKQIVVQLPLPSQQEKYLRQVARTAAYMSIASPIWDEPVTHVQSNHVAEATCLRPTRYWNQKRSTSESTSPHCIETSGSEGSKTIPIISFEFDLSYYGGDYYKTFGSEDVHIPVSFIEMVEKEGCHDDEDECYRIIFERFTGFDRCHLIHWNCEEDEASGNEQTRLDLENQEGHIRDLRSWHYSDCLKCLSNPYATSATREVRPPA